MTTLFLFVLATIGLTNVLVHGSILDENHLKIRPWIQARLGRFGDLLSCYECAGWWSGLIMGLTLISYHPAIFIPCAFAGSAIGHFYTSITNLIDSNTSYEIAGDDHEQSESAS